ncbi:MAG TPA: MFS transporter, partial [Gaiellaceae bacterium]
MRGEIDRRAITALSAGHFATDYSNGALPALLPFLDQRFVLSYTQIGALVLVSALASSIIQPLFGLWSDRRGALWLLPFGVLLAGTGMALTAASASYELALLFVVVSGIGTAAYHPEGSKFAAYVSGSRRASGMSLFSIGGNLGVAIGA